MAEVMLVEDSPIEASLAAIAIALCHPSVRVHEANGIKHALSALAGRSSPTVVILGWRALKEVPAVLPRGGARFVGFAANLSQQDAERALAAGVESIRERPQEWRAFCDALGALLKNCLPELA